MSSADRRELTASFYGVSFSSNSNATATAGSHSRQGQGQQWRTNRPNTTALAKTKLQSSAVNKHHHQQQQQKVATSLAADEEGNSSSNARTTCEGDVIPPSGVSKGAKPCTGVDRCAVKAVYDKLVSLIRHDHNVEAIRYLRACDPPLRAAVLRLQVPEVSRPIIHLAVDADSPFLLELLLRTYNVDADLAGKTRDGWPCTALWLAVSHNRRRSVAMLLKSGAMYGVRCGRLGTSLLEEARSHGEDGIPLVKLLIGWTNNVNEADSRGVTSLMDASARGLTELVTWLVKGGAKVNLSDGQGHTALHHACVRARDGPSAALHILLSNGGDPYVSDVYGCDVIMASSVGGSRRLMERVIDVIKPSPDKVILAYELAGATKLSCLRWWPDAHIHFDTHKLALWRTAAELYAQHGLRKEQERAPVTSSERPEYGGAVEWTTMECVEALGERGRGEEMEVQSCLIIERVLGSCHPFIITPLSNLEAFYRASGDIREINFTMRLLRVKDNQWGAERDEEEVVWEYRTLCERLCLLSRSLCAADTHKLATVITRAIDIGVDKIISISETAPFGSKDDGSLTLCLTEMQLEYLHLLCTVVRIMAEGGEGRAAILRITRRGVQRAPARFSTLLLMAVGQTVARACCGNVQNDAMLLTVIRMLLRSGVDISARDRRGLTALQTVQAELERTEDQGQGKGQGRAGRECLLAIAGLLTAFNVTG